MATATKGRARNAEAALAHADEIEERYFAAGKLFRAMDKGELEQVSRLLQGIYRTKCHEADLCADIREGDVVTFHHRKRAVTGAVREVRGTKVVVGRSLITGAWPYRADVVMPKSMCSVVAGGRAKR